MIRSLTAAAFVLALGASGVSPVYAQASPECFGQKATIVGTSDSDELVGTNGDDVIVGLAGRDGIDALGGDDLICAGPGLDGYWKKVLGGAGNDRIAGGGGRDEIEGGPGDDRLYGGFEPDLLDGGEGRDFLSGGHDNDEMLGGPGDDVLNGGPDFEGDTASFQGSRGLRVDLGAGVATSSNGRDRLVEVESAHGSKWSDVLIGDDGPNSLSSPYTYDAEPSIRDVFRGLGGDDYISPAGNPRVLVVAGRGDDTISGEGGGRYFGGPGHDWIDVYYADNPVWADGGAGNDQVTGARVRLHLTGGPGNDQVWGDDKRDTLAGGPGKDVLGGGSGDDDVSGDGGNDELYGGDGADHLDGGEGDDACADAARYTSCEKQE